MKSSTLVAPLLLALTAAASAATPPQTLAPVEYVNKNTPGPKVIVLPGEIKTTNQVFRSQFTGDSIADWAELELGTANFNVLERADLSGILQEIQTAYSQGDPDQVKKYLKKGKLKSTKYIVRFDVLRAELTETKRSGVNGAALARTAGGVIGAFTGIGRGGNAALTATDSVKTESGAGTWVIGMRYKVIDANTTEQVATGYHEDTVEVGGSATTVAGISGGEAKTLSLDGIVRHLVQENVADIDSRNK